MNIGVILGSVREGRNGEAVGKWVMDYLATRSDENVTYELVDLKDYDLPLLGTQPTEARGHAIQNWSSKIASFDGYVIITARIQSCSSRSIKKCT
ncbi:NAD(P)H-dependent oxidoreductase [Erysipelothrix sp. D19-032]